jgi:hypothetical protein
MEAATLEKKARGATEFEKLVIPAVAARTSIVGEFTIIQGHPIPGGVTVSSSVQTMQHNEPKSRLHGIVNLYRRKIASYS